MQAEQKSSVPLVYLCPMEALPLIDEALNQWYTEYKNLLALDPGL